MAVGAALGPGRAIASAEDSPAVILDEHRLAFDHHQELVLAVVPVPLRRPGARLQHDVAGAEVGEARRRTQPPVPASGYVLVERRRIAGPVGLLDGVEIDLGHLGSFRGLLINRTNRQELNFYWTRQAP